MNLLGNILRTITIIVLAVFTYTAFYWLIFLIKTAIKNTIHFFI